MELWWNDEQQVKTVESKKKVCYGAASSTMDLPYKLMLC
jgi:hypothetical protein